MELHAVYLEAPIRVHNSQRAKPGLHGTLSTGHLSDQITDEGLPMLGWEFFVLIQQPPPEGAYPQHLILARWMTGTNGIDWLNELVSKDKAQSHGGCGYPNRYSVAAGVLAEALSNGVPRYNGPMVIGDDYVMPAGWTGSSEIDLPRLQALDATMILFIEVWDQS